MVTYSLHKLTDFCRSLFVVCRCGACTVGYLPILFPYCPIIYTRIWQEKDKKIKILLKTTEVNQNTMLIKRWSNSSLYSTYCYWTIIFLIKWFKGIKKQSKWETEQTNFLIENSNSGLALFPAKYIRYNYIELRFSRLLSRWQRKRIRKKTHMNYIFSYANPWYARSPAIYTHRKNNDGKINCYQWL